MPDGMITTALTPTRLPPVTLASPADMMMRVAALTEYNDTMERAGVSKPGIACVFQEREALISLALTQCPISQADAIAVLLAAHSKLYETAQMAETDSDLIQHKLGASIVAIERVAQLLASQAGLTVEAFGARYTMCGVEMRA